MRLLFTFLGALLMLALLPACSDSEAPEETDLDTLLLETHWLRQPASAEAEIFFSFCPNTDLIVTRREDVGSGVIVDTHSRYRYEVNTNRNTLLIYWTDEVVEYSWTLTGDMLELVGVSLDRAVTLQKNGVTLTVCE